MRFQAEGDFVFETDREVAQESVEVGTLIVVSARVPVFAIAMTYVECGSTMHRTRPYILDPTLRSSASLWILACQAKTSIP